MSEFIRRENIGPVVECEDHDSWCVPGAISAATGFSTGQVAKVILKNRKDKFPRCAKANVTRAWHPLAECRAIMDQKVEVGGVYSWEYLTALDDLGVKYVKYETWLVARAIYGKDMNLSLAALCDNLPESLKGKILLVSFSAHMICVQDGMICDNRTFSPIPRKKYRKGRSRVYSIIEIVKPSQEAK